MKTIASILAHRNHKKILKNKEVKVKIQKMKELFSEYNVPYRHETEFDFYRNEMMYNSVQQKEKLEILFYDYFTQMYDYWYEISYQERKHLMQRDKKRIEDELFSFQYEGMAIYIPIFTKEKNYFYNQQLIMLEYPRYARIVRHFNHEIHYDLYGYLPYQAHFTSLLYTAGTMDDYILYQPQLKRLYHKSEKGIVLYCFNQKDEEVYDMKLVTILSELILKDEKIAICDFLITHHWVTKYAQKKLMKMKKKLIKKEVKR